MKFFNIFIVKNQIIVTLVGYILWILSCGFY